MNCLPELATARAEERENPELGVGGDAVSLAAAGSSGGTVGKLSEEPGTATDSWSFSLESSAPTAFMRVVMAVIKSAVEPGGERDPPASEEATDAPELLRLRPADG